MEPQQYRPLGPEEIIQEGDEFRAGDDADDEWFKSKNVGQKCDSLLKYRRPIPVAKSATVDPDESSDNSRSFQEIERLKEWNAELSSALKWAKEIAEENWNKLQVSDSAHAALKLRAEKAEAEHKKIMDLWRMMRNWMIGEGPQEAFRFADACKEAKGDVVKTWLKIITSFWKEIRELRKECDEAKEYNQIAEANAAHADARIEALMKERDTLRANETRLREALEKISNGNFTGTYAAQIAQAALAGKGEK